MNNFCSEAARWAVVLLVAASVGCNTVERSEPDMKLYVFDCGNILVRDVSLFSPGVDEGKPKQLTNSCYLIRHPQGDLLWDTGIADSIGPKGIDVWDNKFNLSVNNPLASQLEEIGVKPEEIEYLGISHFHGDHTGNANQFSDSALLIQQKEFDAAFGAKPEEFGFAPDSYNKLSRGNIRVLQGDHDLFGDGRVVIKDAPGHTPGHQMLFLDLPETGAVLLSGDLYHFTKNRTHRRVPSFNFDKEQTLDAMEEMEKFAKEHRAQLWIQHDLEQNKEITHAPKFYR